MIANSFTAEELCAHGESLRALARDLLADDDLAGDVVQQAYAAALARPPASRSTLSVWLRTVVRHCALDLRRTEHRRSVRERIAARPEAIAGADTAERFELQQDILAAVRGLGEPYCTVVWLRYYEQCSPAQIAARLRAPVKTIKTRLWRALGLLRQRLDSRYGDRRGWMLLLAPLDRIDSGSVTLATVVTTGAILMQGKKIALAIAAGIMAVAGVGLFWPDADARLASEGAAAVTPVVAAPTVGAGAEATPDRHVVAAESRPAVATPEPYGSLLVRVTWHDGTPAADVAIAFRAEAEPALDRNDLRAVSDAAGLARAHRLHAGAVTLTSDRGGEVKAEVAAGAAREVPFVLPAGIDVTGIVEDDRQQPVAGAHVFLAAGNRGWLTNRIVATTAGDGAFAVRAVLPRAALGAIATGFAPSSLVYLDTIDRQDAARSADVRLRLLRRGATVEGRVTDEHGQGVASALVAVGRGFDGNMHRSSRFGQVGCPEVATSDGKGNFHCDGVEPGRHPIMVRADGYALWSEQVDCAAGETTKVAVELSRGVTVQGTVRNEKGEVVADAVVMSVTRAMEGGYLTTAPHDYAAAFARPDTRSDAAGRYRLQWVPPGELHLLAGRWSDGNRGTKLEGSCQETLAARAGDVLEWNPVLAAGKTIQVRVVDADGKPGATSMPLIAIPDPPATGSELFAFPDKDGRFEFSGCDDVPYTVTLQTLVSPGEGWAWQSGVQPGGPEVVLRLPRAAGKRASAIVRGRVVDSGRRLLPGKKAEVQLTSGASFRPLALDGDRFVYPKVEPGRYALLVNTEEGRVFGGQWFDVQPAQDLDVGDLVTEPAASISVLLRAPAGLELGEAAATLDHGAPQRSLRWDGRMLHADNVSAGRHRLTFWGKNWIARPREVDLVAGQDNEFQIDATAAVQRRLEIAFPPPDQWRRGSAVLRDARGEVVAEDIGTVADSVGMRSVGWRPSLPLGEFTLEVTTDSGHSKSWPVDLRDPATAGQTLRFSLR